METRKYCVYNQTRESFLSLGVAVADTAAKQLKVLMESLSIDADGGLWLTPFRGVPATKGLTPVDLIYLDDDNRVIQAIESFPNHAIEPTRDQPASALILAGHTIFSTQTQPGDTLLICVPNEMDERLARLSNKSGANSVASGRGPGTMRFASATVVESPLELDRVVELQIAHKRLKEKDSSESDPNHNAPWFIRFLRWLSTDRRGSKRHPLPGLVAYYWTGGAPQAFHIADISTNGLYLLTDERWFPGTMILMTLQRTNTDGDDPDDFISVLTKVIRWGTDGVGLSFVPSNTVDLNSGETLPETGVGKKALQRFIQRVQAPS
jgi:uncharacterized membrane protein (UPF0127 family)